AITTVLFPLLADHRSDRNTRAFAETYQQGVRLVFAITVPAGVGLIILGEPIVSALFAWGAFRAEDARGVAIPLALYALALPSYALATLATRAFHANRDMKTPVRASVANFVVNLVA